MKNRKQKKAFTLIELLVVIAIIAILSVVVILSLNPAELLRQSRDSNRISDMATLKSALSLYLADGQSGLGTNTNCYTSLAVNTGMWVPSSTAGAISSQNNCLFWMPAAVGSVVATTSRSNAGTGWIPVNFNLISSGAPIGSEPVDAQNVTGTSATAPGYFYSYEASGTVFKLGTFTESLKYSKGGTNDVESTDGGTNNWVYEQGTNLSL